MFQVTPALSLPDDEIQLTAIRAQGAGGQNVNKVSAAIHLRFDIPSSSLPEPCKQRLLELPDRRISARGIIVIKAQRFRAREQNISDALNRLRVLLRTAMSERQQRIATRPSQMAGERRLEGKARRGRLKQMRGKVEKPAE